MYISIMYLLNRFEHEHEIINQQIYNMSEYIIIVLKQQVSSQRQYEQSCPQQLHK
jgi:hypothetical protein